MEVRREVVKPEFSSALVAREVHCLTKMRCFHSHDLAPLSLPARTQEGSLGGDPNWISNRDQASGYNLIWELGDPFGSVERALPTLPGQSGERLYFAT